MKYNFDNIVDRRKTNSVKWGNSPYLEMWVADMDFAVLPEIKEAIISKANIDAYGYVCPSDEYFESYVKWWKKRHNVELKKEWLIFSNGVVASIDSILKRFATPKDEVVMLTPVYNIFFNCIKNNGCIASCCSFVYKNGEYSIDFKELERLLKSEKAKFLLLCNPHNPSGTIFTKGELKKIVDLAVKYDVLIISDEIHCDITHPKKEYTSILSVCGDNYKHVVVLLSSTKAFNLAGLHTSAIAVPYRPYRTLISKAVGKDDIGEPNYFACEAAIAAFTYGEEYNKQLREYVFKNKQYVKDFFTKEIPSLKVVGGDATYLMWIDISSASKNSDGFTRELEAEEGLHICSGLAYGIEGKTFIRINVATSLENVKECCKRLKHFILKK